MPASDLDGVKLASGRRALAHRLVLGCGVGGAGECCAKPLSFATGSRDGPAQPPHAKTGHDGRGDDAQTRRRQRCRAEERIGIAFWIAGVPGSADIVKVDVPKNTVAGINRLGICAARNKSCAIGANTKTATKRLTPP